MSDGPRKLVYIPFLGGGPKPPPPPVVDGEVRQVKKDIMARNIYQRMVDMKDQQRVVMMWNSKLEEAACRRLRSMAEDGWAGHIDPWGHGPDWYVRAEGYHLPDYYWTAEGDHANHVESLSYGGDPTISDDEQEAHFWKQLVEHQSHYNHLAGADGFSVQVEVGVCVLFDSDSDFKWYLSIITAPPEGIPAT